MQLNSLRAPFLASLSFGTLLCTATGQTPAAPAAGPDMTGLPPMLLFVPGGTVEVGLDFDQVFEAACQVAFPSAPRDAQKRAAEKVVEGLRLSARTMGRKKVDVPGFFLAKWPVKNSEYEVVFNLLRAANQPIKPPLHWWTVGQKDDFEKRRPDIDKAYPKQTDAVISYWEKNFAELPFALKDEKGASIGDLPVVHVSWRDANDFAGYLGMRLPTEVEMTRASRGDTTNLWPSDKQGGGATYSADLLKQLRIADGPDMKLKPVGAGLAGPFGHFDLHGHVWQLCSGLGFRAINSNELFDAEWKKLGKDKLGAQTKPPEWREDRVIAKGGAYNATNAPIQLLIDARRSLSPGDVFETMGFRLAKSAKPGYDMLFSLMQGTHNKNWFQEEQETDLAAQFGAERYELADNGFPSTYHGISFAPVNWLSKEKNIELSKLLERSQASPLLLGTLAITAPLLEPAAPRGIYSLLYRRAGVPKELADAIKQGHKMLTAKKKDGDKADKDQEQEDKKNKWRELTSRFGYTDDDIASKDAATGNLKFVRIDKLEIPIEHDVLLLFGNEGKVLGHVKVTPAKAVNSAIPGELVMEADPKGKTLAKLHFTAPTMAGGKKFAEFHVQLTLDLPAPAADKPWRQPQAPTK